MMRTATLDRLAIGGGAAVSPLHLSRALRVTDHSADLVAAHAAGRGTLDGSLRTIDVSATGVHVTRSEPVGAGSP